MPSAHLDTAASDPRSRPSRRIGQEGTDAAADCRARLGRWLRRLAGIGVALAVKMSGVAQVAGTAGAGVDLRLAWALVARALRWTRALEARLAAEALAEKTGIDAEEKRRDRPERLTDRPDWDEDFGFAAPAGGGKPPPDDCIEGKPVAEVVGQICADLGAAATLLGETEAARQVAAMAEAARTMLGGAAEAGTAPPDPDAADPDAQEAAAAETDDAPPPFTATHKRAPDTG